MEINDTTKRRAVILAFVVFALAVITGLPSLRGGFLAGDDYHLVLNHVLVNHPSATHAFQLLTIVHRDLYQPIPMISFSLDFAILNALGLQPTPQGPHAGAWVFHLTNILIHAANALLVLLLMMRLTSRLAVPITAAALFAIHPLAAEPIAWLNGRMMLLSTCFTLATVITFDRWDRKPSLSRAAIVIICTFLAHMSKVSVALPVLVAVCPLAQHRKPAKRWWVMWLVVAVISGLFTILNIGSSSEMFAEAEGEMGGPKAIYCLLALAQYFRQYLFPIGLSVWYPPPPYVSWTDPELLTAAVTITLIALLALASASRTRIGLLGLLWFFTAVFPTLPVVPARRAIGADRYVYLPKIGLAWITAAALVAIYIYARRNISSARRRSAVLVSLVTVATAIGAVFVAVSWRTQGYYRNDIAAALRNIETNRDFPGVYKQAAWAYYRHGQYENAIDIAVEDLQRHPKEMACEVYQVIGMSRFRLGRYDQALDALHKAIQADPDYGKCYSRLAQIQAHLNRHQQAIANYERAIEIMPFYNPGLIPLASLYRTVGRTEDAVATYTKAVRNNPYEVPAHLGLAEIDIEHQRYHDAIERLQKLLGWMPENAVARTNLGVAYEALNRFTNAADAYTTALHHDPHNAIAAVNLANLHLRQNRVTEALRIYDAQMPYHDTDAGFLIAYQDFALSINRPDLTAAAFINACNKVPTDAKLRVWTAYTLAQAGDCSRAAQLLQQHPLSPSSLRPFVPSSPPHDHPDLTVYLLTRTLLALHDNDPDTAADTVEQILTLETPSPPDAQQRLIDDFQRFAVAHPDNPWPYYHTAQVLMAQNKPDLAALALKEFTTRCPGPDCQSRAEKLTP